jgi:hypothetical protein
MTGTVETHWRAMMKKIDIVEVYSDDWEGLYINGDLIMQGHSIGLSHFIDWMLGQKSIEIMSYDIQEADSEWLESRGRLPANLIDVRYSKDGN